MIRDARTRPPVDVTDASRPGRFWRAAGAALVAAATLGVFSAQASPREPGHDGPRAHAAAWGHGSGHGMHRGGHGDGVFALSPRLLDRIDASPEQREKIRAIAEAARADLRAQHDAGRALRQRSLDLLSQPQVDAEALEALRKDMLAQHDRASQRRLQALVDASLVLTPEQRQRLGEDMKKRRDMMERHHRERRSLDAPKS